MAHTCFEGERIQMKFRITENVSGQDVEEIHSQLKNIITQKENRQKTSL